MMRVLFALRPTIDRSTVVGRVEAISAGNEDAFISGRHPRQSNEAGSAQHDPPADVVENLRRLSSPSRALKRFCGS